MSDILVWLTVFGIVWIVSWTILLTVMYRLGRAWMIRTGRW
jgi:hypothetical protein